jgi:putative ABC transport system substrate-binding protein
MPRGAKAQTQPRRAVIGFLASGSKSAGARWYGAFPEALRELGYVEGRDYIYEERYADGDFSRLPQLAEEVVRHKPDVILVSNTAAALAIRHATQTIPIVGATMTDPVGAGLVASEARPGTNVTGILNRLEGLSGKFLEIARDVIPEVKKIGVLINVTNPTNIGQWREIEALAAKSGLSVTPGEVRTPAESGPAMRALSRAGASVVIVIGDAMFLSSRRQIAAFAMVAQLPTVYNYREHVEDGGLVSYGVSLRESYRRAAYYVNRILKGEKPTDLPIEFPTKLELVLNLATARALDLTIPPSILLRADEVLE